LAVPRLIKFAGTWKDAQGKSLSNTVGLTPIYKDQEGGAPLWTPGKTSASDTGKTAAALDLEVTADITQALTFVAITPCRIIETRGLGWTGQAGPPSLVAGAQRTFQITGTVPGVPAQCGVPDTALAISVNFTVTGFAGAGDLRAFPAGGPTPLASILNYHLENIANATTVPLGPSGGGSNGITVQCDGAGTDFIADVNGYYVPRVFTTLESGQTLKGVYTATASGAETNFANITFQERLASAPAGNFRAAGSAPTANCPGTAANPTAAAGQLCVYEGGNVTNPFLCFFTSTNGCGAPAAFGSNMAFSSSATGYSIGTWAVTAP
jgi:hypothetical protein